MNAARLEKGTLRELADKNTLLSKRVLKHKTALEAMTQLIRSDREERRLIHGALTTELNDCLVKNTRQRIRLKKIEQPGSQQETK